MMKKSGMNIFYYKFYYDLHLQNRIEGMRTRVI